MRIIGLLFLLLTSCTYYENKEYSFDDFEFSDVKFNSKKEVCYWIYKNIKYENEENEFWKTPEETLDDRGGDCEDMAILLMAILYSQFKIKGRLAHYFTDKGGHCIYEVNGEYYDCTSNKIKDKEHYSDVYITYISMDELETFWWSKRFK